MKKEMKPAREFWIRYEQGFTASIWQRDPKEYGDEKFQKEFIHVCEVLPQPEPSKDRAEQIEKEVRRRYPYAIDAVIEAGIMMAKWADENPNSA